MSYPPVTINKQTKKRKLPLMKISKTARQNYILLALAGIFFLIANAGWNDVAKVGVDGIGIFGLLIGGFGFIGFSVALVVRLWDME